MITSLVWYDALLLVPYDCISCPGTLVTQVYSDLRPKVSQAFPTLHLCSWF